MDGATVERDEAALAATPPPTRRSPPWITPLVSFFASRLAVLTAVVAFTKLGTVSVSGVLTRWDGAWYLAIVRDGYASTIPPGTGAAAQVNIAFFPAYPLLVRVLARATGLGAVPSALIISTIAGAAAVFAVWMLAARLADDRTAARACTLFAFLPAAFVLSMVYADAIFVACAALCLLALVRHRWFWAGVAGAAASATRPTGAALIVACATAAVVAYRRHEGRGAWIAPVLSAVGAAAYFVYLKVHTGNALAFFEVEDRGWDNRFDFGITNARTVLHDLVSRRATVFIVLLAIVAGTAIVATVWLVRWRPPAEIVTYVLSVLVLGFLTSKPTSVPRFLLAAFPILIPISARLSERAFAILLATSASLMVVLFAMTSLGTLPP